MLLVIDSFLSLLLYCVFNFMKAEDVLLLSTPLQNYEYLLTLLYFFSDILFQCSKDMSKGFTFPTITSPLRFMLLVQYK